MPPLSLNATGSTVLRLVALALSTFTSWWLASRLGAAGYGAYTQAMAWASVLGIPALVGADQLLLRQVATSRASGDWTRSRGLWGRGNGVVAFGSLFVGVIAIGLLWLLYDHYDDETRNAIRLALLLVPVVALTRLRQGALQGLNRVTASQTPEYLVRPGAFAVAVVVLPMMGVWGLSAGGAVTANLAANLLAFVIAAALLLRAWPDTFKTATSAAPPPGWMKASASLVVLGGLQVINAQTDLLMLGPLRGKSVAGVYAIAVYLSTLVPFFLYAFNAAVAPQVSNLWERRDLGALQKTMTRSVRIVSVLTIGPVVLLILLREPILSFVGAEYLAAARPLTILVVGQMVNVLMGSVGVLLIMTGHERDAAIGFGVGALLNITLNIVLIPRFGMLGAAVATASSTILWNIALVLRARRRLGLDPSVLGLRSHR
ncbi:MAG: flippase [Acidobacteriota bacterium]|nr:flippase [Acidobacteriota bacterium]MDH3786352.1 flippase [Acidobacteriota bacterium]